MDLGYRLEVGLKFVRKVQYCSGFLFLPHFQLK